MNHPFPDVLMKSTKTFCPNRSMVQQLLICFENVGKKIVLCFVIHGYNQNGTNQTWCGVYSEGVEL